MAGGCRGLVSGERFMRLVTTSSTTKVHAQHASGDANQRAHGLSLQFGLAAVMKGVAITNHVCASPGLGAAVAAGVSSGFGVAAASGGPGAALLPG